MSEFLCRNGHDMPPSAGPFCRICGSRVAYMDGMSSSELRRQEEYEREHDIDDSELPDDTDPDYDGKE